ncbi:MAG: hypothetical protein AVDCRST_MAG67-44 [uncultured Solirubrobacteraceae bacterium]|uniref:DUF58 domain-containing protein n=1 Tax=uncultured Solirubrobacteraceae bacterium TaxID=1162706 RepID=A0A6J4RFF2_9ACTN|nr:MAG: hypothetical protein AVDCRST_MAG67-44 [uncultured Solirubrobacteraceae bacterium]
MSPTPRAAAVLAAIALLAVVLGPVAAVLLTAALAGALIADAVAARRPPRAQRRVPAIVARGVPAALTVTLPDPSALRGRRSRVRQATVGEIEIAPQESDGGLEAQLVARRRGRWVIPPAAVRVAGPLGLATWDHRAGGASELLVYPDLPAARRLALAVRSGAFRESGRRSRGPLGLGTEFESIREYLPDDDIRQVNWPATARLGRPMSNQYRVEQDRDVICVLDCGRLMAAPLSGGATRLDAAIDAATAVGLVADELGDRCGTVAFDARVHRRLAPRRRGGDALVRAVYDLQPAAVDSDYELAFRNVASSKRALVIVFTDLIEEVAARSLVTAVPVLARRHEVVVAGVVDPDLEAALRPSGARVHDLDVYRAAAALDMLAARERAAARVRGAGARVLETAPPDLARACVAAYLSAKARARL